MLKKLGLSLVCDVRGWCGCKKPIYLTDDDDEIVDNDAINLSHVGNAAYELLRTRHSWHHKTVWDVTSGAKIGVATQTPRDAFRQRRSSKDETSTGTADLPADHDEWFPENLAEIVGRTERWCDVMSLAPPDGAFAVELKKALKGLCEKSLRCEKPIIVRLLFGNIPAAPVNCDKIMKQLTRDMPPGYIQLWVGSWRKDVSWNHAKIVAVDGRFLWTGGHNFWDRHYLRECPIHDLSLEMEGRVAIAAHRYVNEQWQFIERNQSTLVGYIIDKLPDNLPMMISTRVTVSEYPQGEATIFPPPFTTMEVPHHSKREDAVPIITIGRLGTILYKARPSDDAIVAMFDAARTVIRMALQDLGPMCFPGTKMPYPGLKWPVQYLSALARGIWLRGVDVEIVLSNPSSVPGGLKPIEASYGYGWTCVDVAAEIIKFIKVQFPGAQDHELRKKVEDNLRISVLREPVPSGNKWDCGMTMGMHAKHFIVDDVCTYIGSQNLYVCDLAEWGVVIDDANVTKEIMQEYWCPMWKSSYRPSDCDVLEVMDGLNINRCGDESRRVHVSVASNMTVGKSSGDYYDDYDDDTKMVGEKTPLMLS